MVTMSGSLMEPDEVGAILDLPILLSTSSEGMLRIAYLNPESAAGAGVPLEQLVPVPVWTALRELPVAVGLVVDPEGERLVVTPDEVDVVLGAERTISPIISRRRRAVLATRWVLFHKNAETGRPLAPVEDDFGRRFAFAWTDEHAAIEALSTGNALVQVPLHVALRSNPDVSVILDSGSLEQLVIDAELREQILYAASGYFPKDYLAAVAELTPEARAPYEQAARTVAAAVRSAGLPLGGVWVAGYRLERADSQIMFVVDADLDAAQSQPAYAQTLSGLAMPPGPTVALLSLSKVPNEFHAMVRTSPDFAAGV